GDRARAARDRRRATGAVPDASAHGTAVERCRRLPRWGPGPEADRLLGDARPDRWRFRGRDRFRRSAGRDDRTRYSLPNGAGEHREADHDYAGNESPRTRSG